MSRTALVILAVAAAGACGGSPTTPEIPAIAPPVLAAGTYTLSIYSSDGTCLSSSFNNGPIPDPRIQGPVAVTTTMTGWRVLPAAGAPALQIDLVLNGSSVEGRGVGTLADGDLNARLDHVFSGSAAGATRGLGGSLQGSVTYSRGGGFSRCADNLWTLMPRP